MSEPHAVNGSGTTLAVADIEATLSRIPSVTAARVVGSTTGKITEVHVLATPERSPKQIVRDVQSVALATFGLEVDYRTVSVVQLEDDAPGIMPIVEQSAPKPTRAVLGRVAVETRGAAADVTVAARLGERSLDGAATGAASMGPRLVARATINAMAVESAMTLAPDVEFADFVTAGSNRVALVILRVVSDRGDQLVSGSAVVKADGNDAMSRATLSALNRLL